MVKQSIAATLQVAGGVSLTVAGFFVGQVVGFVALGVIAILFGVALEHESTPDEEAATVPASDDEAAVEREKRGEA